MNHLHLPLTLTTPSNSLYRITVKCQDTSLSCMPTAGTAQGSVSAITPRHADSCALIRELCKWFAIYGVHQEISTYGGQPYTSHEMQAFLTTWGISHRLSSAYYPQSNGRAQVLYNDPCWKTPLWYRWECCHYFSDISRHVLLVWLHTPSGSKTMKHIYCEEAVVLLGPGVGFFCKLSAYVHVKSNIWNA